MSYFCVTCQRKYEHVEFIGHTCKPSSSDKPSASARELAKELVYSVRGWGTKSPQFMTTMVDRWEEKIKAFAAQEAKEAIEALRLKYEKAMRGLESLTPSGSEYVGDVERCVAFVKESRASQHRVIIDRHKRAEAAESSVSELREALNKAAEDAWMVKAWCMEMRQSTENFPLKEEWIAAKLEHWKSQALAAKEQG